VVSSAAATVPVIATAIAIHVTVFPIRILSSLGSRGLCEIRVAAV
jgi:hypothetical protein